MREAGALIFLVCYALISARRLAGTGLDRPAIALCGAVACVASGALTSEQALAAIDGATLLLLLGMMGIGAFLSLDGFFEELEPWLVRLAATPARLAGLVVWGAGLLSALLTNDAVCVLGAPLIVRIVERHRLPPVPLLLALATGANTGSVATLVGNPQNMLCGLLGGLRYAPYALQMIPLALVCLALNHLLVLALFRAPLAAARLLPLDAPPRPISASSQRTLLVLAGTAALCAAGTSMPWTAAGGLVALLLLHRRDSQQVWRHIDWSLLLFFAGLFVLVEGLLRSPTAASLLDRLPLVEVDGLPGLAAVFLVGSNLVSNVPFILVIRSQMADLPDPALGWTLLAMASTFAGNLTLLGSAANIIVAEAGRPVGGLGFWQHLRLGLPLALLSTALGTLWLMLLQIY